MSTRACIGYKGENGKVAYVVCRYDGYVEHVGMLLAERYNDLKKVVELLQGGDIVSLGEDPQLTERERPMNYDQLEDYKVKIANGVGDYLLNAEGEYKYLFDEDKWHLVDGRCGMDRLSWVLWPLGVLTQDL